MDLQDELIIKTNVGEFNNWADVWDNSDAIYKITIKSKIKYFPDELSNITQLVKLKCNNSELEKFPNNLEKLVNLEKIEFENNKIKEIPNEIKYLIELHQIICCNNFIKILPIELFELKKLILINVGDNLIENIPPEIEKLDKLSSFEIYRNRLTKIPKEFVALQNITNLWLFGNKITEFPIEICYLKKLNYLAFGQNEYSTIPKEICNLQNLETIGIYMNKLTTLPNEFYQLDNLKELWFFGNVIEEAELLHIYEELTNMKNLRLVKTSFENKCDPKKDSLELQYYDNTDQFDKGIMYHLIASSKGNINSMKELANYYKFTNDIDDMIKYYVMAINSGDIESSQNLAKYYNDIGNIDEMIKYIVSIDDDIVLDDTVKNKLLSLTTISYSIKTSLINMFLMRKEMAFVYAMCKKHNIVNSKISSLLQILDNKMKMSIKNDCPICYNNTDLILYECFGHYYCLNCIHLITKCSICCIDPNDI